MFVLSGKYFSDPPSEQGDFVDMNSVLVSIDAPLSSLRTLLGS